MNLVGLSRFCFDFINVPLADNIAGPGCYNRMKGFMANHVETTRDSMFAESCNDVKKLLLKMCKEVEAHMAAKADEVFLNMQRDYIQVITGATLPEGQMMQKWERQMRSDVAKLLEGFGKDVVNADAHPEAGDDHASPSPAAHSDADEDSSPQKPASEDGDNSVPSERSSPASDDDMDLSS